MTNDPPPLTPPRLSLRERDRRWQLVRQALDLAGLDCLITPGNTGHGGALQADSRFLTDSGVDAETELACVFPLNGDVTAIATDCESWRTSSSDAPDWVVDLREASPETGVASRLGELDLPRRRVGIVGLSSYPRAADGIVSRGFMAAITEARPDVEWVDCTEALQAIRATKSTEEIALLTRGIALLERAIGRIAEVARPGVRDSDVWSAMIGEICRGGGEIPTSARWGSGVRPTLVTRPTHGALHRGHLIVTELEAPVQGYRSRVVQPFAVLDCDVAYKDLYAIHADYWQRCFAELEVGRPLSEFAERCAALAADVLPEGSRYQKPTGHLSLHGCGLGSDAPIVTEHHQPATTMAGVLADGWVFLFKPSLEIGAANRRYRADWGDVVVMTEAGPKRLGTRPPGLIVTQNG